MDQFRLPRRIIGSPLEFSRYDLRISIPRIIVDKRERSSLSFVFPQTFLPFSPLFNKPAISSTYFEYFCEFASNRARPSGS